MFGRLLSLRRLILELYLDSGEFQLEGLRKSFPEFIPEFLPLME